MTSTVDIDDTAQQWVNHFKRMAEGKIPPSKTYVVSKTDTSELRKASTDDTQLTVNKDRMMDTSNYNKSTGELIDVMDPAVNK
jgi:hypothetical protein